MKISMTWKDPGAMEGPCPREIKDKDHFCYKDKECQEIFNEMDALGIGEYITIEYDTHTKQARIVP